MYNVLQSVIEKVSEEKHHHRQAVGCYQTGNVSGPVGKLGRGLVAASNIQTTSTFTFSFKPTLSLSHVSSINTFSQLLLSTYFQTQSTVSPKRVSCASMKNMQMLQKCPFVPSASRFSAIKRWVGVRSAPNYFFYICFSTFPYLRFIETITHFYIQEMWCSFA